MVCINCFFDNFPSKKTIKWVRKRPSKPSVGVDRETDGLLVRQVGCSLVCHS